MHNILCRATSFSRLRALGVVVALFAVLAMPVMGAVGTGGTAHAEVQKQDRNSCDTSATFFGLVPWYKYLTLEYDNDTQSCRVTSFDDGAKVVSKTSPILLILLAILEDLIRVSALVAVGFIVYGGIQYITSQGSPDDTKRAQQTIINALIGLVIALIAVGAVSFLGTQLGGNL